MAARELLVVLYGVVVGRVAQRNAAAEPEFTYESSYLAARPSTPLSVRMPLTGTTYRGKSVRAFLEGVLPEDPRTRQHWAAALGVEPDDTSAVLSQMGWDCPGAVQFCEPAALREMQSRALDMRPVSDGDIGRAHGGRFARSRRGTEALDRPHCPPHPPADGTP